MSRRSPSPNHGQRLVFDTAGAISASLRNITLYSVASAEQFVNNEDDRGRGKGNNPFGNYYNYAPQLLASTESTSGPFPAGPGFTFGSTLYTSGSGKKSAGSSIFTCLYGFDQNGSCDVAFQLSGGTLIGVAAFRFSATHYAVAITGGTGEYRGAHGNVDVGPSGLETAAGAREARVHFELA